MRSPHYENSLSGIRHRKIREKGLWEVAEDKVKINFVREEKNYIWKFPLYWSNVL